MWQVIFLLILLKIYDIIYYQKKKENNWRVMTNV